MLTYKEWCANDKLKLHRVAWQEFLGTEAGALGLQVLASRMLQERRIPLMDSKVIETTAIQGAQDEGYRCCYNNLFELRNTVVEEIQKRKKSVYVENPEGATLPISDAVRKFVESDPIYSERK